MSRNYWSVSVLSLIVSVSLAAVFAPCAGAQEESVKPGINKSYETTTAEQAVKRFETEKREIAQSVDEIVAACRLKPGMDVADVGAGTGLLARPFAAVVAPKGKVFAVDITKQFLEHIEKTCKEQEIANVECVLCTPTSTELPAASVDLAFTCDTYHHFEFPAKTLASIHQALRPGGRLIVIDFKREEGVSADWVLNHIRAGKETVIEEVTKAGFKLIDEPELMKTQFVLRFKKTD